MNDHDSFDPVSEDASFDTLILGIGNILWADEGFGVRVVEDLHRSYHLPKNVRIMDGGTQGLYLVQYIQAARNVLVFDAIDFGDAPGTLRCVFGAAVPSFMGCKKMSLHQTGFQDVLAAADLMGTSPDNIALIGVQAEELDDWGGSLRPGIKARIEPAIAEGLEVLEGWGIRAVKRNAPLPAGNGFLARDLDMAGYERREGTV